MNTQDRITLAARALPRSVSPGHDLWPEIESRLESVEPLQISAAAAVTTPRRQRAPLALAAGLLLAISIGFWLGHLPHAPDGHGPTGAQAAGGPRLVLLAPDDGLQQTRLALAADIERRLEALSPSTREVVLDNLGVINQALDDIDVALQGAAESDLDARLLLTMYADQLVLLNTLNNTLYASTTPTNNPSREITL